MTTAREEKIASAINDINNGISQRDAAELWEIPQATLNDRIHGATSKTEALLASRRLSPLQESFLIN